MLILTQALTSFKCTCELSNLNWLRIPGQPPEVPEAMGQAASLLLV